MKKYNFWLSYFFSKMNLKKWFFCNSVANLIFLGVAYAAPALQMQCPKNTLGAAYASPTALYIIHFWIITNLYQVFTIYHTLLKTDIKYYTFLEPQARADLNDDGSFRNSLDFGNVRNVSNVKIFRNVKTDIKCHNFFNHKLKLIWMMMGISNYSEHKVLISSNKYNILITHKICNLPQGFVWVPR